VTSSSGGPTLPAPRRARGRGVRLGTTALLTVAATTAVLVAAPVGSPSASGPRTASVPTAVPEQTSGRPTAMAASGVTVPEGDPARPPAGEAAGTTARSPERTPTGHRAESPEGRWSRSARDPLLADLVAAGLVPGTVRWSDDPASILPQRGQPRPAEPAVVTPEGFHVVAGTAAAGDGETVRYTVELDPMLRADPDAVADTVEAALHDARSWARDRRLERVEDPDEADIRVLLAHPDEVDALCGAAGLDTEGRYSCWTGEFAALNAWRWEVGAHDFDDLDTYRRYLINHEFGHGLGYGHVDCPAPGELAPVMMQQSITTAGCVANGWPHPDPSGDANS
jgi:hypothetical protein